MDQNEANADKLKDDRHREEFSDRMALLATAVDLNRHKENVNGEEDETLLEDVLLVVREVIDERAIEAFLERIAIDQLHMVAKST